MKILKPILIFFILIISGCSIEKIYTENTGNPLHAKDSDTDSVLITYGQREPTGLYRESQNPLESNSTTDVVFYDGISFEGEQAIDNNKIYSTPFHSGYADLHEPINSNHLQQLAITNSVSYQEKKILSNNYILIAASFMGLTIIGLMRSFRKRLLKLTRWAKSNPKKAQLFIAGIQVPLMGLGFYSGHLLNEMDLTISENILYLTTATTLAGFALLPFNRNQRKVVLPADITKRRMGYMAIILSSLLSITTFGNQISEKLSTNNVHVAAVYANHDDSQDSVEAQMTSKTNSSKARALLPISCGLSIFLIILLLPVLCGGVCLVYFGLSYGSLVSEAIIMILGGLLASGLSIWAIVALVKSCIRPKQTNQAKIG